MVESMSGCLVGYQSASVFAPNAACLDCGVAPLCENPCAFWGVVHDAAQPATSEPACPYRPWHCEYCGYREDAAICPTAYHEAAAHEAAAHNALSEPTAAATAHAPVAVSVDTSVQTQTLVTIATLREAAYAAGAAYERDPRDPGVRNNCISAHATLATALLSRY